MLHFKPSKLASLALTGLIAVFTLVSAAPRPAIAADVPRLAASDLFVDLDKYVGKPVVLESMHVFGANNDGALAASGGVTFSLSSQGMDRETLRLLFTKMPRRRQRVRRVRTHLARNPNRRQNAFPSSKECTYRTLDYMPDATTNLG